MKQQVDTYLQRLKTNGDLHAFNAEYRRRRVAAKANGKGFMSYSTALARLRNEVMSKLGNRNAICESSSLLNDVFGG